MTRDAGIGESRAITRLGTTVAALGAILVLAAPAVAQDGTVVAKDLDNPRQMDTQRNGTVYVAEAGRGGPRCLGEGEDAFCHGFTSGITRVTGKGGKQVSFGLLSAAPPPGFFAGGLSAIAVSPFGGFVGIMNGFEPLPNFNDAANLQNGALMRTNLFRKPRVIAQVDDFDQTNDPDEQGEPSNPYGVEATEDGFFVADASGNALYGISPDGEEIETVHVFEDIEGRDAVPTSVRQGPDGALYVGTLVGEAAGEEDPTGSEPGTDLAKVYRIVPGEPAEVYADGLNSIVGLDFDSKGNLYVAEFTTDPTDPESPLGDVVRITPGGIRTQIGFGELFFVGGVAIGRGDEVYVSNWGVLPGGGDLFGPGSNGQVVRFPAVED